MQRHHHGQFTYSATTFSPNEYSINYDAAEAQTFADVAFTALPATPIVLTVPAAAAVGTYNYTLTVRNTVTGCVSTSTAKQVTVNGIPTITLGANPAVCRGTTTANLTYSATTFSPNEYSINYDAAAEAQTFADVAFTALPATPIVLTVPAAAAVGTYNYTLTVRNTVTGCVSTSTAKQVTVNGVPTITLGANPSVCRGAITANLTYSATTYSPTQYSIDYDAVAEGAGFVDVINAALPLTPLVLTIPAAVPVAVYNATITVLNGCNSSSTPFTVTVNGIPTITTGVNPEVCQGITSANLPYIVSTYRPDQYSIDYNAAAEAAGFVDVVNAPLPVTPIVLTVPSAGPAATYSGFLSVFNSSTGCTSTLYSFSVKINPLPVSSAITGATNLCIGDANKLYRVDDHAGSTYAWTVPAAISSKAFDANILLYTVRCRCCRNRQYTGC
ncbi:MAG: hypothetical protein IPN68_19715 [Bacteroidetes bacterium]|nr:hypothetical protein [Bacteroidota bacterium]